MSPRHIAPPRAQSWVALILLAALAAVLLWLAFAWPVGNFWLKTTLAYALLAGLSLVLRPPAPGEFRVRASDVAWGLGSAAALWLLFWLGKIVATAVSPFAAGQISGIYGQGGGAPQGLAALVLFLFTGPCEELFWRRYMQKGLQARLGPGRGWLIACALYAGVHLASANFMLIGAAAVAGAFWGLMYWRLGRIMPLVISHTVWSVVIFLILPIP